MEICSWWTFRENWYEWSDPVLKKENINLHVYMYMDRN